MISRLSLAARVPDLTPPDRPADFLKEGLELLGEQKESEEHGEKHPEG